MSRAVAVPLILMASNADTACALRLFRDSLDLIPNSRYDAAIARLAILVFCSRSFWASAICSILPLLPAAAISLWAILILFWALRSTTSNAFPMACI